MRRIISILLQNEAGALARVAGMFSTRGFNIESLSVAPTEDPTVSRLTLESFGSDKVMDQIVKQLFKLIDVVNLADMTTGDHFERELLLMKLNVGPEHRQQLENTVAEFDAKVLDDSASNYSVELTSTGSGIDAFVREASACGRILAVVRSGSMALTRGDQVLTTSI